MDYFNNEIYKYGYLHYTTPLEKSGTGTLISGSPQRMIFVAHPHTCFPKIVEGKASQLRFKDNGTLPNSYKNIYIDVDLKGKFFEALRSSSPSINFISRINEVKEMKIDFKGVHIEYMDIIRLVQYYQSSMSELCREYIAKVPFIIQSITVDSLVFEFFRKNRSKISIDMKKIKQFIDFKSDIEWEIEEGFKLVIKTPKHIGYQLGLIKLEDKIVVMTANSVRKDNWLFKNINVMKVDQKYRVDSRTFSDSNRFRFSLDSPDLHINKLDFELR